VIEAELDLHSTFDSVDTGTFRAVPGSPSPSRPVPSAPWSAPVIGPANSDVNEEQQP